MQQSTKPTKEAAAAAAAAQEPPYRQLIAAHRLATAAQSFYISSDAADALLAFATHRRDNDPAQYDPAQYVMCICPTCRQTNLYQFQQNTPLAYLTAQLHDPACTLHPLALKYLQK